MRVFRSAVLVAVLLTQLGVVGTRAQVDDRALYAPLLDGLEGLLSGELDESLPRYEIDAIFEPAGETTLATLTGTVALDYVNWTGGPQTELHLRLYPNNPQYADGAMSLDGLVIDGQTAEGTLALDDTLLTVELGTPLAAGDRLGVSVDFETTVPTDPARGYGMFKYDSALETYALAHWFPMLAGIDAEGAWLTEPLSENGDPVFSNSALFAVRLGAPAELVVVTSGNAVDETDTPGMGVGVIHRFASGPSRDFVMAASDAFEVIEERVGETTVRSFAVDGSEDGNELVLTGAVQSLALFNRLIGDYPYEELDLVQIPLGNGAGGVEFPGILYIGADYYEEPGTAGDGGFLEFVVVHEVIHQWWYAVVGNNQYVHAFIDEALTNYLTVAYYYEQYGEDVGDDQTNRYLKLPYFTLLFEGQDEIVDQPTDEFRSSNSYGAIVYGKGALGFGALREEIGDEAFFAALAAYYAEFQFTVATPDDLLAAFETAAGQQLDEFWRHWFQAAEGNQDYDVSDLADLLIEIGAQGA